MPDGQQQNMENLGGARVMTGERNPHAEGAVQGQRSPAPPLPVVDAGVDCDRDAGDPFG